MIPFPEYAPDRASRTASHLALNCRPISDGYGPIKSRTPATSALPAKALSGVTARSLDGAYHNYVGTQNRLYRLVGNTWTNATRVSGGDYQTDATRRWEFAQWGNTLFAVNLDSQSQSITLGNTNFADVSGISMPRGAHIATIRDFVMLGNTWRQADGFIGHRLHWSAFRSPTTTSWAEDTETQADKRDLRSASGNIQAVIGGEYGVVFQEKAISRLTYIGTPFIWQVDETVPDIGMLAPYGWAQIGSAVGFLSEFGFMLLLNGGPEIKRIGHERLDKTFFNDLDTSYLHNVVATAPPRTSEIWFAYPGSGNIGGRPNKGLIYNVSLDRWSHFELEIEAFQNHSESAKTLEELDSIYATLESIPGSLDESQFSGGGTSIGSWNENHALAKHSGDNKTATIATQEIEPFKNAKSLLTGVKTYIDSSSEPTVTVRHRESTKAQQASLTAGSRERDLFHRLRVADRLFTFEASFDAGYEKAEGIDIEAVSWGDK